MVAQPRITVRGGQNPAYRPSGIFPGCSGSHFFALAEPKMLKHSSFKKQLALSLVVLALAVRMFVPAGWMPTANQSGFTLCTGLGKIEVWVDGAGELHKSSPPKQKGGGTECAFAGLLTGDGAENRSFAPNDLPPQNQVAPAGLASSRIGQGLAAPPPPSTGPPAFI